MAPTAALGYGALNPRDYVWGRVPEPPPDVVRVFREAPEFRKMRYKPNRAQIALVHAVNIGILTATEAERCYRLDSKRCSDDLLRVLG